MKVSATVRTAAILLLLLAVYVVTGKFGLALAFDNRSASPVWPNTALALVACILLGYRAWPAVFFGALAVNLSTTGHLPSSALIAAGNTLEAVVGAWLAGGRAAFSTAGGVSRFALLGCGAASAISATFGSVALVAFGLAPLADAPRIWGTWWLGDSVGAVILVPTLLLWIARPPRLVWGPHSPALLAGYLAVLATAGVVFLTPGQSTAGARLPVAFLCLPAIVGVAYVSETRHAAPAALLLAVVAITGTMLGRGPFVLPSQGDSLLVLQAFIGICTLVALLLSTVVTERRSAEAALVRANAELEGRVAERTAALSASEVRYRALSGKLVEAQEAERRALAHELHDEVGQLLTLLAIRLDLREDADSEATRASRDLVAEIILRVRHLSLDLRPAMLDDLGLLPALLWMIGRYTEHTAGRVELAHAGLDQRFPGPVETGAFRIVQEALTNVARHSGVVAATVCVLGGPDSVTIEVSDRGRGFDPATLDTGASTGLVGMRERARLLGGTFEVESGAGGTQILVRIPLFRIRAQSDRAGMSLFRS